MGDEFQPTHPPREGVSERLPGDAASMSTTTAKEHLRSFVERIVRLEDEKKTFADDIKEVYGEAKSNGFDTKALRRVVKLQRMDQSQKAAHNEVETILETYMQALGML